MFHNKGIQAGRRGRAAHPVRLMILGPLWEASSAGRPPGVQGTASPDRRIDRSGCL